MIEINEIGFDWYEYKAKRLPIPLAVYGSHLDDDRIVLLIYEEELQEAA